jgi:DNA adenine methylase
VEIYNDRDEELVNFFRVLRDPELFQRFQHLVSLTPYARVDWRDCRETWQEQTDPVERAYRGFVVARQSFGGCFGRGWGFSVATSQRGMAGRVSSWLSCIDSLPAIAERLLRVQIDCLDWRDCLTTYDTPETFFYCDPPYVPETRKDGGYTYELTEKDHQEMVARLLTLQGQVILSGYPHPIYQPLRDAGWDYHEWNTVCYTAGRTRVTEIRGPGFALAHSPRVEAVWMKRRWRGTLFEEGKGMPDVEFLARPAMTERG